MLTTEQYLTRAAEKFLAAWERQDGQVYTVGCGITYAANMLGKGVNATPGLTVPGSDHDWWGDRYLALAISLTTP